MLSILYRGPLASCDYDCPYCPFAKRRDNPEQLRADRAALARFTSWVTAQETEISVLFTPWGEGLVRSWYREALVSLSLLPQVRKVAIQTNLSGRTAWTARADLTKLALWTTFHPGQVTHERFLAKSRELTERGVRHSVGIVGLPEHLSHARRLRDELSQSVYLWVNAAEGHSYTDAEAAEWTALDPLFPYSRHPHRTLGLPCHTGHDVVSVAGDGTVTRCHFLKTPLGNLYDGTFQPTPEPTPCSRTWCDCHIGYVHFKPLRLYDVFTNGILERIPNLP